ncbi:MAG: helix-turn-helix transcriptional regulator [Planctomycetaceae bacterium]|nr:helix-turn-helix transcriptional regulator [Planctomycetaceae bacterium]
MDQAQPNPTPPASEIVPAASQPSPVAKKAKQYDDDELCLAIAKGNLTQAQMGEQFGLTEDMIGKISRGERRPDLQPRIRAISDGFIDQARRMGARAALPAFAKLYAIMSDPTTPAETSRKAARDLLTFVMPPGSAPTVNVEVNQTQQTTNDLPAGIPADMALKFYEFLAASGGPPVDPAKQKP